MTIPTLLAIFALVLAVIDQIRWKGESLTTWAVILVAVALLWGVYVT